MIPYVAAGSAYVNRVTYTPSACGTHTIYVIVKTAGTELSTSTQISTPLCWVLLPWVPNQ